MKTHLSTIDHICFGRYTHKVLSAEDSQRPRRAGVVGVFIHMGPLILGESVRVVDERFRVSIPPELVEMLAVEHGECILAKERPGCLSLWNAANWQSRLTSEIGILEQKVLSRHLDTRLNDVQRLGRMLSTRHRPVTLAGRGRLALPEGFRDFLEIEPGSELVVVGAALCIELWQPAHWRTHVGEEMPEFRKLLDALIGN